MFTLIHKLKQSGIFAIFSLKRLWPHYVTIFTRDTIYHELGNIDVNWFFISQYLTREKAICSFDIKSVHYLVAIIMHTWVHCYFLWIAQEIELNIHMLLHQQQKMIWCKKNEICTPLIHCVKLMQQYQEQSMRVKFPTY